MSFFLIPGKFAKYIKSNRTAVFTQALPFEVSALASENGFGEVLSCSKTMHVVQSF